MTGLTRPADCYLQSEERDNNAKVYNRFRKTTREMLYRSQMTLAVMCLDEANRNREDANDWPAGQKWNQMVGSSHAIFCRRAREKAGIDHNAYLDILPNNEDAVSISVPIYEELLIYPFWIFRL